LVSRGYGLEELRAMIPIVGVMAPISLNGL
jgi:hypothetical protein